MNIVTDETTNEYLTQPVLDLINQPNFVLNNKYKNTMNIITGPTGLGKTWATFNYIVPELFDNKDLQLIIYSYPTTEIWEESYKSYITDNTSSDIHVVNEVVRAKSKLKQGKKVFLHLSNQALVVESSGLDFLDYITTDTSLNSKIGIFCDEVNQWMTSDQRHYKEVQGWKTKVKCMMYKKTAELSNITPYCFGLTATPQAEQRGDVIPIGDMKYNIVNEYPNLATIVGRTKAIGEVHYFDIFNKQKTYDMFEQSITKHMELCELTGKYPSMIINVKAGIRNDYTLDTIVLKLQEILSTYTCFDINDNCIAIMTGKEQSLCSTTGKTILPTKTKTLNEQDIKDGLADSDDKLMFLFVIEKGKSGLSINSLVTYFSFRPISAVDSNEDVITEMAKQKLGRFHRLYTGIDMNKYSEKWGYGLTNYVPTLNKNETEKVIQLNSYNVYVPDDEGWHQSVEFVKQYCSPSIEMLRSWVYNLQNDGLTNDGFSEDTLQLHYLYATDQINEFLKLSKNNPLIYKIIHDHAEDKSNGASLRESIVCKALGWNRNASINGFDAVTTDDRDGEVKTEILRGDGLYYHNIDEWLIERKKSGKTTGSYRMNGRTRWEKCTQNKSKNPMYENKLEQLIDVNPRMAVAGFTNGKLVYIVTFDFGECSDWPRVLAMSSPTTKCQDWVDAKSLALEYLNEQYLDPKILTKPLYNKLSTLNNLGV